MATSTQQSQKHLSLLPKKTGGAGNGSYFKKRINNNFIFIQLVSGWGNGERGGF